MSNTSRTWMPLYIGDYTRDTNHLRAAEHGAYLLLLFHYWATGGPLPDDDRLLSTIARTTQKEWKIIKKIISPLFKVRDGKWYHSRVERELAKARERYEKRARAGKLGGLAKRTERSN